MSTSSFKIAHKLLTGPGAIEQLAAELTRLDVDNPLIVTDAALVKSGTVALALEHLGERTYEIFDRVLPDPEIAIVEDCMRVYREGGHDGGDFKAQVEAGVGLGDAADRAVAPTRASLHVPSFTLVLHPPYGGPGLGAPH